ncbi:CpaF family protein [Occultella aeris]|uniref:Conjugal transfer protein/MT3759 n=1 Tax=Occultella aeris TaxID=2761496 RepID=A0A7M4DJT6_9MICO|nr:CpaF/VirB11 family protein [Occultella aeris]VZO37321.1 Putative conjugal transfer protein/MT3759 [Occultella aeris]
MSTASPPQQERRSLSELPLLKPPANVQPVAIPATSTEPERPGVEGAAGGHRLYARAGNGHLDAAATPRGVGGGESFWQEVEALRAQVSTALAGHEAALRGDEDTQREIGRSLLASHLREHQGALMREGHQRWDPDYADALNKAVMAALFGLGRLEPLVEADTVENVEITGCDQVLVLHSDGRRERAAPVAESDERLIRDLAFLASRRSASGERSFTRANPMLSLSLPPDLRLQASAFITPRPKVVIRKDRLPAIDLAGLRDLGELDEVIYDFLSAAVRAHKSIVVSGRGQGSGKTTLLRALIGQMDPWESIVTAEDIDELRIHQVPERHHRVTSFVARPGTGEVGVDGRSAGEYTLNEVVYGALRFNADRVVVGEVRGSEVIPMFKAMQMGNGSFSTIHANSARDVVERLVTCAVEDASVTEIFAYRQVYQHIDLIVFLDATYDPVTGQRYRFISQIIEVTAPDDVATAPYAVNEVFMPGPDRRAVPTGVSPTFTAELNAHGFQTRDLSGPGAWPTGGSMP